MFDHDFQPLPQISIADQRKLSKSRQFVNKREFRKLCKAKWGMTVDAINDLWTRKISDDTVPKSEDEMSWVTISWLAIIQSEGARIVSHTKSMEETEEKHAMEDEEVQAIRRGASANLLLFLFLCIMYLGL
jgi:hypothetical protein